MQLRAAWTAACWRFMKELMRNISEMAVRSLAVARRVYFKLAMKYIF